MLTLNPQVSPRFPQGTGDMSEGAMPKIKFRGFAAGAPVRLSARQGTLETGTVAVDWMVPAPTGHPGHGLIDGDPSLVVPNGFGACDHYMLQIDPDGGVVVEPGRDHIAIYIGKDATDATTFTAAEIETTEGLPQGTVTSGWIVNSTTVYGRSPQYALSSDQAEAIWSKIEDTRPFQSNWILLERGGTYPGSFNMIEGETPLHPALVGAWGTGPAPILPDRQNTNGAASQFVYQGLTFDSSNGSGTIRAVGSVQKNDVLISDCRFSGDQGVILTSSSSRAARRTLFEVNFTDIVRASPVNGVDWTDAWTDRESALYISGTDGVLVWRAFADHSAWADDYDPDGVFAGGTYGQPPSKYSHNFYMASSNTDTTYREIISLRAASSSMQWRSGGTQIDVIHIDNNIGHQCSVGSNGGGNFNQCVDVMITSAGYKTTNMTAGGSSFEGAKDWGLTDSSVLAPTVFSNYFVTHAADPNDPADQSAKPGDGKPAVHDGIQISLNDYKVFNWLAEPDEHIGGLDSAVLNATTIQRWTDADKGDPAGTNKIPDLASHLRALPMPWSRARPIWEYFADGFGVSYSTRSTPQTVVFLPWNHGDGFRWDNRRNWSTNDRPGEIAGDSADLNGATVVTYETVTLDTLDLGPSGVLRITGGRTRCATLAGSGAVTLRNAGQLWIAAESGLSKQITIERGRFANEGTILANLSMTVQSDAECLLAVETGDFTVAPGQLLRIEGNAAWVGFDGVTGGSVSATLMGRLEFIAGPLGFSPIQIFRSGAFGTMTPNVTASVTLGGTLAIDATGLPAGSYPLIDVDSLSGGFSTIEVTGTSLSANVSVDAPAGTVTLALS
jgi:hypothetical protein